MHDFMLAKEIVGKLSEVALAKKIKKIKKVYIEIGQITMAHNGHPEHTEDISVENLQFGLKSIAKDGVFRDTEFFIRKVPGDNWKIVDIEV
jgi:Zn finger protein HypA/HybF involved in hydrogenase expression